MHIGLVDAKSHIYTGYYFLFFMAVFGFYAGEKAVRELITQGRKFADACQGPDKGRIRKVCDDLDKLMGDLAQLRKQGKVGMDELG